MTSRLALCLAALVLVSAASGASAQALRCTGFLHGPDGSWRALEDGPILAPNGIVRLKNGEILRPTAQTAKGEIARSLNHLCEDR